MCSDVFTKSFFFIFCYFLFYCHTPLCCPLFLIWNVSVFSFSLPPCLVSSFFHFLTVGWYRKLCSHHSENARSSNKRRLWVGMSLYSKWLKPSWDQQSTVFLIWEVNFFFFSSPLYSLIFLLFDGGASVIFHLVAFNQILMECFKNIKFPKVMTHAIRVSLTKSFI